MNFDLSDEQKLLADSAERYVREKCTLENRRATARSEDGFSREHWANFAEMGWLALPLPEDAGGLGMDCTDVALLMEPLGAGLVCEPLVDTIIIGATLVSASDNAGLREQILGNVAAGECILSLAHIEPGGRFEYDAQVASRATKTADGWKLNGTKQRVFHAAVANYFLVSAQLEDRGGYAIFAVERGVAGINVSTYRLIDGTVAADIVFSNVALDANALVLAPESAPAVLDEALDRAIIAMTAAALGSMEAVMQMTSEYLKTRVQYGQTLSAFQALQHRMAEMFVETDQARSMLYRALAAFSGNDVEHRRRATSGAKVVAAKALNFVTAQGIQLHGGIGVTAEYEVGHHYKAMLVYDKRFGDAAFHLARSLGRA